MSIALCEFSLPSSSLQPFSTHTLYVQKDDMDNL